jgi:hypothetical protein
MKEKYIDLLEHEIKFKVENDFHYRVIVDKMKNHFLLFDEKNEYVTDLYFDTDERYFFMNDMSYRIRTIKGSGRARINFKFPNTAEKRPVFIRREIKSKLKKKGICMDNPLSIQCTVNDNVRDILLNTGISGENMLVPSLVVKTKRKAFWVVKNEKDIASRYSGQGLAYLDFSLFYNPNNPMIMDSSQEFEFELWSGAICSDLLDAHIRVAKAIEKCGVPICVENKYVNFVKKLDAQNKGNKYIKFGADANET